MPKKTELAIEDYLDPLSLAELELLRAAPYDTPYTCADTREVKIAAALRERGLLERDPSATRLVVRCTERGARASAPLTKTYAARIVEVIRHTAFDDEDHEAAATLERRFWLRVLIETAIGLEGIEEVAATAAQTQYFNFRRG